jgi:hypothetical protein
MMSENTYRTIELVTALVIVAFYLATCVLLARPDLRASRLNTCWKYLKWLCLAAYPVSAVTEMIHHSFDSFDAFTLVSGIISWWLMRDAGDDDWKKMKEKLTEKIVQIHGRLVVLPVSDPA